MMNILLLDPPSLKNTLSHDEKTKLPMPNAGLLYIASYITSKHAVNVKVVDMPHNQVSFEDIPNLLNDFQPDIVGISAKTFNILSAYKLSRIIKKARPDIVILLGGAHGTALPELTLKECSDIDAVVIREGEYTLSDIIDRKMQGADDIFADVDGIVYLNKQEQITVNKDRELIADLDSLPFPDLSLVDYSKYKRVYNPNKHKFQHVYSIFGSRGCPFNCSFCMPFLTRKHRVRSVGNILDEIEHLHRSYGAERIYFDDSLFCIKKDWFISFCDQYAQRGLHKKVQWGFETRIDAVDTELFRYAKKCWFIYTVFGIESGNEDILRKNNKKYSIGQIIEKVTAAREAKIDQVCVNLILGLPYETQQTIEDTLQLMKDLPYDHANISILHLLPGTQAFDLADNGEAGLTWLDGKQMNWEAYSEDAPMASVNDVTPEFLLAARERGMKILAQKTRENKLALNLKRLAYLIEYARTDRRRLVKKLQETIRGTK